MCVVRSPAVPTRDLVPATKYPILSYPSAPLLQRDDVPVAVNAETGFRFVALSAFCFLLASLPLMARGTKKDIPDDTKKLVVHLYYNRHRKQADIAADLQICLRRSSADTDATRKGYVHHAYK